MLIFDNKDMALLARLRRDARESLSSISRAAEIPVTTLFYKHRKLEKEVIIKYSSMIDFAALGYGTRAWIIAKAASRKSAGTLLESLETSENVNNIYRVSGERALKGCEYLAEAIFTDAAAAQEFAGRLYRSGARELSVFFVSKELKKEDFLTRKSHFY